MIRDLLNRFAQSELKKILLAEIAAIEQAEQTASEQSSVPVREFLERRQA